MDEQLAQTMIAAGESPPGLVTRDNVWQFGVLGVAVFVLGWVVWFLFRRYDRRIDENAAALLAMEKERGAWAVERLAITAEREKERLSWVLGAEKVRTEFEVKHRELSTQYATALADQVRLGRENETAARREYADTLEDMAEKHMESSATASATIDKLTDRIVIVSKPPTGRY
jgi:flagellar biosynthesis/type III secretory pathway M-ring protein FliF/YscJ